MNLLLCGQAKDEQARSAAAWERKNAAVRQLGRVFLRGLLRAEGRALLDFWSHYREDTAAAFFWLEKHRDTAHRLEPPG